MSRFVECASSFVVVAFTAPCALAGVLTVGGTNPSHPDIASAVAAAVDGDVLLVRAGSYTGFTVDGKALAIVADTGAAVTVDSTATVRNLPAGKSVLLAGLSLTHVYGSALLFENDAGRVRVEAVTASPASYVFSADWFAAEVTGCADVAFVGCTLSGRDGEFAVGGLGYGHAGEPAIYATASTLTLHECVATGGVGVGGHVAGQFPTPGGAGAAAVDGVDTVLFTRGSQFTGGRGGTGFSGGLPPPACTYPYSYPTPGGVGGSGVRLAGALSTGWLVSTSCVGGAGGMGGSDPCGNQIPQSPSGPPIQAPPGSVTTKVAPAVALAYPQPARELQNIALHFTGPAGSQVLLLIGNGGAGYSPVSALQGVLLVQPPLRRLVLGTIPVSGVLDVQLPVADLGPGVEAQLHHAQAVFITNGRTLLASPAVVVMLDAAF